jgi:hypothetical protein
MSALWCLLSLSALLSDLVPDGSSCLLNVIHCLLLVVCFPLSISYFLLAAVYSAIFFPAICLSCLLSLSAVCCLLSA